MRSLSVLPTPLLVLLSAAVTGVFAKIPVAAPPENETVDDLQINTTTYVSCSRPTRKGDGIEVNYRGRLLKTGAEFDSSYNRRVPFKFRLGAGSVIKGWDLGLLDMCPGEARELTIPPELGYGDHSVGKIPVGSTLVFDTELVRILGVKQESVSTYTPTATGEAEIAAATTSGTVKEESLMIATAPPSPLTNEDAPNPKPTFESEDRLPGEKSPSEVHASQNGQCELLGPFALLVQGALGAVAVLTLVVKRYRETPKRPWKIWFFDVSKQVLGSVLLHGLNLAMSMLGSGDLANGAAEVGNQQTDDQGRKPNPCSFYLLNLGIDTTIGIPVLYVLLKVLHKLVSRTPLANPPESIDSGNYGSPPHVTWYLKQLIVYFVGLIGMKLFVYFLFAALPWLPWVGDWALRWTEGNEALQIAFAMFAFPLAMNAVQYWIIDSFIKDNKHKEGYERVQGSEDGNSEEHARLERDSGDTDITEVEEEEPPKAGPSPPLRELNPTPIPSRSSSRSGRRSPKKDD